MDLEEKKLIKKAYQHIYVHCKSFKETNDLLKNLKEVFPFVEPEWTIICSLRDSNGNWIYRFKNRNDKLISWDGNPCNPDVEDTAARFHSVDHAIHFANFYEKTCTKDSTSNVSLQF